MKAYYKPYDIIVPCEPEEPEFKRIPPAPEAEAVQGTKLSVVENDLAYMKRRVMELDIEANRYVSPEEFEPIRKLLFAVLTTILMAVAGALISLTIST